MFKLFKCIFILSLTFITANLGLNPNLEWNIERDKISFMTNIENYKNTDWSYSFNIHNDNYTGDSIMLWKENKLPGSSWNADRKLLSRGLPGIL
jgi:hypothetical protein